MVVTGSRVKASDEFYGGTDTAPTKPVPSATARSYTRNTLAQDPRPILEHLDAVAAADASGEHEKIASDGRSGPLLVYEAEIALAVYKVDETEQKAIDIARGLGGHLVSQDAHALVMRVPAAKFEQALTELKGVGEMLGQRIHSEDVTSEFRDLNIRLRNAEQVRDRLAELLARANDATAALAVEKELDRVTEELERIKGELRAMEERIAFSKITLLFQVKKWETLDPDFRLPFDWLQNVGLQQLLSL